MKYTDGHAMEVIQRARYVGRGTELSFPLQVSHFSSTSMCSPTQKLPKPHTVGIFMEALSRRHDQSLTQFPALLWRMGYGTESSKLLIMACLFW